MPQNERKAIEELKKKQQQADKGRTTVIMNKTDKINEGQTQLDVMVEKNRAKQIFSELHRKK